MSGVKRILSAFIEVTQSLKALACNAYSLCRIPHLIVGDTIWSRTDPHPICRQASALFKVATAQAVRAECDPWELYHPISDWAEDMTVDGSLLGAILRSRRIC